MNISTLGNSVRVGAVLDNNNYPAVVTMGYTKGYFLNRWNGVGWDSLGRIETDATAGGGDRCFTINWLNGNIQLVRTDGNQIVHYQGVGGSRTVVSTMAHTGIIASPISCVRGNTLYLFWWEGASIADNNLYMKRWDATNGWDADSTIIATGSDCQYIQTVPKIETDKDFVPVFWHDINTEIIYMAKVYISAVQTSAQPYVRLGGGVTLGGAKIK